jgi:hypothetical protein
MTRSGLELAGHDSSTNASWIAAVHDVGFRDHAVWNDRDIISVGEAPLAKGSRFGASVAAHGERLATARLQLEEKITDPAKVFNRPTVMRRYFPQLAAARQTKPPVDELTMSLTDNLAIVDVWAGSAELTIPDVRGEDVHSLAPLRIGRGYRLGMSYSVTDLRILKNYVA